MHSRFRIIHLTKLEQDIETPEEIEMDKPRAYVEDLELGCSYIESNPWHWDCEYDRIWYVGTSYNKYDELVYCFSEEEIELPDDYDGNASMLSFGGPIYTESEIDHGCIAMDE